MLFFAFRTHNFLRSPVWILPPRSESTTFFFSQQWVSLLKLLLHVQSIISAPLRQKISKFDSASCCATSRSGILPLNVLKIHLIVDNLRENLAQQKSINGKMLKRIKYRLNILLKYYHLPPPSAYWRNNTWSWAFFHRFWFLTYLGEWEFIISHLKVISGGLKIIKPPPTARHFTWRLKMIRLSKMYEVYSVHYRCPFASKISGRW